MSGRAGAQGEIMPYEDYLTEILAQVSPLAPVSLAVRDAAGRRCASVVLAPLPAPLFTNSAMDGFACAVDDLIDDGDGFATLPVTGDIPAGQTGTWSPGAAVRIMTGAPVPFPPSGDGGPNTVVPVEFTDQPITRAPLPRQVRLPADWPVGRNIRYRGSDVAAGEELLPAGTRLDGPALAALQAVGVQEVSAYPRVQVGIIVTGDELSTGGMPLEGSTVPDSNSTLIYEAVASFGAEVVASQVSSDDPKEFTAHLRQMLRLNVDLLITTGGASVGAHDVVRHVLAEHGVSLKAVGIQPAKPQGFGVIDGVAVCALPGNPGAVHASVHAIVHHILARLGSETVTPPRAMTVTEGWTAKPGMRQFVPVVISGTSISPVLSGGVASHRVRSLARADGLANVAPEITEVQRGDVLPVIVTRS